MEKEQTKTIITAFAIFFFSIFLLYCTTDGIGITCDEAWINDSAAHSFAEWMNLSVNGIIRGDFTNFRSKETIEKYFGGHFHYHPPFGRMMHALSLMLFGNLTGEIKALRISPEIMFSLTCALVFLITLRFCDYTSSVVASLGLLFMPRMFGHAHLFTLDMPITFMWVATVFFFIKSEDSRIYKVLFTISLGLSFCTKANSALIPASILIWLFFFPSVKRFSLLISGTIGAMAVFFFTNPWFWVNSNSHFQEYFLGMASHSEDFVVQTFYLGAKYDSNALPCHYPFLITFFTIPAPFIFLLMIGIAVSLKTLLNRIKNCFSSNNGCRKNKFALFFLINAFIPVMAVSAGFVPSYDGERLFLPAFPFFAILSGLGFYKIKELCFKKSSSLSSSLLGIVLVISSAFSLYSIHPFELSYYNIFSGGLKGAKAIGLESTYWGDAFNRNALSFMNKNLKGENISGRACFNAILFDYYHKYGLLSEDILYTEDDFHYLMINHREGLLKDEDLFYIEQVKPVFSNHNDGITLLSIYKNVALAEPEDFILSNGQRKYWKDTSLIYNSGQGGNKSIKFNGRYRFPLITSSEKDTVEFSSIEFNSIFNSPEEDYYTFYIFGKGKFSLKIDNRLVSENNSSDARYLKINVKLEKGYHFLEGVYKPSDKRYRFFAVLSGNGINKDLTQ